MSSLNPLVGDARVVPDQVQQVQQVPPPESMQSHHQTQQQTTAHSQAYTQAEAEPNDADAPAPAPGALALDRTVNTDQTEANQLTATTGDQFSSHSSNAATTSSDNPQAAATEATGDSASADSAALTRASSREESHAGDQMQTEPTGPPSGQEKSNGNTLAQAESSRPPDRSDQMFGTSAAPCVVVPAAAVGSAPVSTFDSSFRYSPSSPELLVSLPPFGVSPSGVCEIHSILSYDCVRRDNLRVLRDGILLYTSGNLIVILDLYTHQQKVYPGLAFGLGALAVHPEREYIAIADQGESHASMKPCIRILHYPSLDCVRVLRCGTEAAYSDVNFSLDGERLVSVGAAPDYSLTVWEWRREACLLRTKAFSQEVLRCEFTPHNKNNIITCGQSHIRFWTMAMTFTGRKLVGQVGKFGTHALTDIRAFVELHDGKVLTSSDSGNMLLWDNAVCVAQCTAANRQPCHEGHIEYMSLDPANPKRVITAGADGYIRLWPIDQVEAAVLTDDDPTIQLTCIRSVLVGCSPGTSVVGFAPPRVHIKSLVHTLDQQHVVVQDARGAIWRCDRETFGNSEKLVSVHAGAINAALVHQEKHIAITLGADQSLRCWDIARARQLYSREFIAPCTCGVWLPFAVGVGLSSASAPLTCPLVVLLIVGFGDGTVRVLRVHSDAFQLLAVSKPHSAPIRSMDISPDGKCLATADQRGQLFMAQISTTSAAKANENANENENANANASQQHAKDFQGAVECRLTPLGFKRFPARLHSLQWHPKGETLLAASANQMLQITRPKEAKTKQNKSQDQTPSQASSQERAGDAPSPSNVDSAPAPAHAVALELDVSVTVFEPLIASPFALRAAQVTEKARSQVQASQSQHQANANKANMQAQTNQHQQHQQNAKLNEKNANTTANANASVPASASASQALPLGALVPSFAPASAASASASASVGSAIAPSLGVDSDLPASSLVEFSDSNRRYNISTLRYSPNGTTIFMTLDNTIVSAQEAAHASADSQNEACDATGPLDAKSLATLPAAAFVRPSSYSPLSCRMIHTLYEFKFGCQDPLRTLFLGLVGSRQGSSGTTPNPVTCLSLSPCPVGSAHDSSTARCLLLGLASGQVQIRPLADLDFHLSLKHHTMSLSCVQVTRDAQFLCTAGLDGSFGVYRVALGKAFDAAGLDRTIAARCTELLATRLTEKMVAFNAFKDSLTAKLREAEDALLKESTTISAAKEAKQQLDKEFNQRIEQAEQQSKITIADEEAVYNKLTTTIQADSDPGEKNTGIRITSHLDSALGGLPARSSLKDVTDIVSLSAPSIQQQRLTLEQSSRLAACEKQRHVISIEIQELRKEYQFLKVKNQELSEEERLPHSAFELDPLLRVDLAQDQTKAIQRIDRDLAQETERHTLALAKLHEVYLARIETPHIRMRCIQSKHTVATYRLHELPQFIQKYNQKQEKHKSKHHHESGGIHAAGSGGGGGGGSATGATGPGLNSHFAGSEDDDLAVQALALADSALAAEQLDKLTSDFSSPAAQAIEKHQNRVKNARGQKPTIANSSQQTQMHAEQQTSTQATQPRTGTGTGTGSNTLPTDKESAEEQQTFFDRSLSRLERVARLEKLRSSLPDPLFFEPRSVALLAYAESHAGDYKLKSALDYIVPEHSRVNAQRKHRQMIQSHLQQHKLQNQHNERFIKLRHRKRQVLQQINECTQRLAEIKEMTRSNVHSNANDAAAAAAAAATMDSAFDAQASLLDPTEWPELRDEFCAADLDDFDSAQAAQAEADLARAHQSQLSSSVYASPMLEKDTQAGQNLANRQAAARSKDAHVDGDPNATQNSRAKLEPNRSAAQESALNAEREDLESRISLLASSFDAALIALRHDKARLDVHCASLAVRLHVQYSELQLLQAFEETEQKLNARVKKARQAKQACSQEMAHCQSAIKAHQSEIKDCQDREKQLALEFHAAIAMHWSQLHSQAQQTQQQPNSTQKMQMPLQDLSSLGSNADKEKEKAAAALALAAASAAQGSSLGALSAPGAGAQAQAGDLSALTTKQIVAQAQQHEFYTPLMHRFMKKLHRSRQRRAKRRKQKAEQNANATTGAGAGAGAGQASPQHQNSSDSESSASGSSRGSRSGSSGSNSDGSDTSSGDSGDESCPSACDPLLYERVMEFRERKLELESLLADLYRHSADAAKVLERHQARDKQCEAAVQQCSQEAEAFQSDKQKALNRCEITLPMHAHQITNMPHQTSAAGSNNKTNSNACTPFLPASLDSCLVLSREQVSLLLVRIDSLGADKAAYLLHQRLLRRDQVQLHRMLQHKESLISAESRRAEQVQLVKFGEIIDVALLDQHHTDESAAHLAHQIDLHDEERARLHTQWSHKQEDAEKDYLALTVENTQLLQKVKQLTASQYALDDTLNQATKHIHVQQQSADNSQQQQHHQERHQLLQLVKLQESELSRLKAELHVLRRKGTVQ